MLEEFQITITPFQRERKVRVYLPKGYDESETHYPVLYMHDGQNLYRDEDASYGMSWRIADFLNQSDLKLIVVGIDCAPGDTRLDEYGPWVNETVGKELLNKDMPFGGEGKQYIDFIVEEFKPFIDRKYRTIPNETAMAGSSMGGLISTYAACKYPHIFNRVASFSSAYWFNQKELEQFIQDSDLSAVEKFYLDVGTKEVSGDVSNQKYVESSQAVYDLLKKKVADCRFEIIEDAVHNETAWSQRVPNVFNYLFK
ncbi:alpha/beta hydrolase [Neobacillus sp. D3-1R]|uniref:alpha/beta hydrolase n=1 Tax=Neobacillus sp. D3-1R TaxID=3445778 RepID=UPI003F9F846A